MVKLAKNTRTKSIGVAGMAVLMAVSVSACGTTSVVSKSAANRAPVTYKVDQAAVTSTSLPSAPYTAYKAAPTRPQTSTPQYKTAKPILPARPARGLDMRKVDTDLYAHQRVGKTYTIFGKQYTPRHQPRYDETGTASWYGDKFHGKPTATGELYDMDDITAAHKTLPLNSMVYVTNLETGKGMMVRVNDRGPFVDGRIIDLSRTSAKRLGLFSSGLARVRVQYAGPADPMAAKTNKRPIARPKTPSWSKTPKPGLVAEKPSYKPLRELKTQPAAPVALEQYPFQPAVPKLNDDWREAVPQDVEPFIPLAVEVPEGDAPVTLTIKGPVHLASNKADGSLPEAKFIPAVNYTQIPAEK